MTTNKLAGILLIVFGVLLAGASGLCCLMVLSMDGGGVSLSKLKDAAPLLAIFGGIPFLFGSVAIMGGVLALRNDRRKRDGGDNR